MTESRIFVDYLLSAALHNGVVRLEFGDLEETSADDEEKVPNATPKHRLLIPLPGFIHSVNVMQELVKRLKEQHQRQNVRHGDATVENRRFVAEARSVDKS